MEHMMYKAQILPDAMPPWIEYFESNYILLMHRNIYVNGSFEIGMMPKKKRKITPNKLWWCIGMDMDLDVPKGGQTVFAHAQSIMMYSCEYIFRQRAEYRNAYIL